MYCAPFTFKPEKLHRSTPVHFHASTFEISMCFIRTQSVNFLFSFCNVRPYFHTCQAFLRHIYYHLVHSYSSACKTSQFKFHPVLFNGFPIGFPDQGNNKDAISALKVAVIAIDHVRGTSIHVKASKPQITD